MESVVNEATIVVVVIVMRRVLLVRPLLLLSVTLTATRKVKGQRPLTPVQVSLPDS